MFFTFRTHLIHWPFASNAMSCMMQQLLLHYQIPPVVIWVRIMSALEVSRTVGDCLCGTLLLRPCWTACPVQIRAHHPIDVYTDSNNIHTPKQRGMKENWKNQLNFQLLAIGKNYTNLGDELLSIMYCELFL